MTSNQDKLRGKIQELLDRTSLSGNEPEIVEQILALLPPVSLPADKVEAIRNNNPYATIQRTWQYIADGDPDYPDIWQNRETGERIYASEVQEKLEIFEEGAKYALSLATVSPVDKQPELKVLTDTEVEKDFNDFWKGLVCNSDGSLNTEQVKKELYDFHQVMHGASKVYDTLTHGRISKPNTDPDVVIDIATDIETDDIEKAIQQDREERE